LDPFHEDQGEVIDPFHEDQGEQFDPFHEDQDQCELFDPFQKIKVTLLQDQ
jgi:hypothetical protein